MITPETPIIRKSTFTDLEEILRSLCQAKFFFKNKECRDIELTCPIYISGEFSRKHEKALRNIVLMVYVSGSELYSMVSTTNNPAILHDRAEYLVYRALHEITEKESQDK